MLTYQRIYGIFFMRLILRRESIMAIKITNKKTNFANNRPNCLKITKHPQKVNLQKITINGQTIKTSAREARTLKKYVA